jgi:ABC-type transporter Mla maintaining outer membrane lipid asymmetry ATPase subunit MlaF
VAVLADKKIVRTGSPTELQRNPNHPWIKEYFCGERARAASGGKAEDTHFRLVVSPMSI